MDVNDQRAKLQFLDGLFSCPDCSAEVRLDTRRLIQQHDGGRGTCDASGRRASPVRGSGRVICGECGLVSIRQSSYASSPWHKKDGRPCPGSGQINARVMMLEYRQAGSRQSTQPDPRASSKKGGNGTGSHQRVRSTSGSKSSRKSATAKSAAQLREEEWKQRQEDAVRRIQKAEAAHAKRSKRTAKNVVRSVVSGGLPR